MAPWRSPRLSLTLRRARKIPAGKRTKYGTKIQNSLPQRNGPAGESLAGRVHGSIMRKLTGLPCQAAASTRMGTSDDSGQAPVQAADASNAISGVHSGVAG